MTTRGSRITHGGASGGDADRQTERRWSNTRRRAVPRRCTKSPAGYDRDQRHERLQVRRAHLEIPTALKTEIAGVMTPS
jgi:hypothetical protein